MPSAFQKFDDLYPQIIRELQEEVKVNSVEDIFIIDPYLSENYNKEEEKKKNTFCL